MSKMRWASGEGEPHGKEEADKGSCGHGGHDDFQALVPNRRGGLGLGAAGGPARQDHGMTRKPALPSPPTQGAKDPLPTQPPGGAWSGRIWLGEGRVLISQDGCSTPAEAFLGGGCAYWLCGFLQHLYLNIRLGDWGWNFRGYLIYL